MRARRAAERELERRLEQFTQAELVGARVEACISALGIEDQVEEMRRRLFEEPPGSAETGAS